MTLQDHMIEGSCDFMEVSLSLSIPTLPSSEASVATSIALVNVWKSSLSRDLARSRHYMMMLQVFQRRH